MMCGTRRGISLLQGKGGKVWNRRQRADASQGVVWQGRPIPVIYRALARKIRNGSRSDGVGLVNAAVSLRISALAG